MIDSTISLAIIVSVCALISAPITAYINNRHQLKLRKLELEADERKHRFDVIYEKKLNAYTALMNEVAHIDIDSHRSHSAILSASQSASLLSGDDAYSLLEALTDDLSAGRSPSENLIPSICRSLNRELTELSATK